MSTPTSSAATNAYVDTLGRNWPAAKLDALLADAEVHKTVLAGAAIGLRSDRTWRPAYVLQWAGYRYTREEPAALMLLLVTRFFDTEGAHYLGRRPVR